MTRGPNSKYKNREVIRKAKTEKERIAKKKTHSFKPLSEIKKEANLKGASIEEIRFMRENYVDRTTFDMLKKAYGKIVLDSNKINSMSPDALAFDLVKETKASYLAASAFTHWANKIGQNKTNEKREGE